MHALNNTTRLSDIRTGSIRRVVIVVSRMFGSYSSFVDMC